MAIQSPYSNGQGDIEQAKKKLQGRTPSLAQPVAGNPARAASMQQQFDQPVTGPRGVVQPAKQNSFDITNTPAAQRRISLDMPTTGVSDRLDSQDLGVGPSSQAPGNLARTQSAVAPLSIGQPVPARPSSLQPAGAADNGYTRTGIGDLVGRAGANGVPEFTNQQAAVAGASAMPVGGIGGKPLRAPGVSNMADDVPLERRGSINNIGNGIGGGLSMGEDGDSQLAMDRFERANQERAKMVEINRRGGIGESGGLTIVKDSSRGGPGEQARNQRFMDRQDQDKRQGRIDQVATTQAATQAERAGTQFATEQQQRELGLASGKLALDSDVRMNGLRAQLADPDTTGEQRALAERNLLLTADPAGYLANQAKSGTFRLDMENKQLEQQVLRQKLDQGQVKAEQTQLDRTKAAEGTAATFELAIGSADRLLEHPGLERAVGFSSIAPSLPGGNAANFEAQLDTLKAQTFLPQVQALKGAGALSDAEGKKLSEAVGALSTRMSPEAFRGELKRVRNSLAQAQERALRGIPAASQGGQAPASATATQIKTDDEYAALPSGAVFTDPNGVTRRKP